jgi:outer membrane receptor protein involved in Fe transport
LTNFKLIMKYLYAILLTLGSTYLFAQDEATGTLTGTVLEPGTGKPIASATIQVFQSVASGDSLIKGTFASSDGSFSLDRLPKLGSMYVAITALGFEPFEKVLDWKKSNKSSTIVLGKLEMKTTATALDNVVITGRRKAFEMKMDRRVFNPDQQITAKGGTGADVLKNIPSVSVDAQGGVELRGSSPQIFVDGRPTILTIEQIAADDIEKVEVITNPSSKYDAATSGGIINIVLKKNKARGLNGNMSAGFGYPDIFTGYIGINIRQKKLNFFATGNYNQSGGIGRGETNRTNLENGVPAGGFNQVSYNDRLRKNGSGRFGVDYFLDDRNTLTFSQGFNGGDNRSVGEQSQTYFDADGSISGTGEREEFYNWSNNNTSTQVLYKRTFARQGRELTADFTYNQGSSTNRSNFTNEFFKPGVPTATNLVRNEGGSGNNQFTYQLDYVNPVGDNGKFEAGLRYFSNDYNSFFNAFSLDGGGESKLPFSNNIEYKEKIAAAYSNYGNKIEKWGISYQVGLRIEYSEFNGSLPDSGTTFGYKWPEDASNLLKSMFPSFYITKDLSENTQLQLNYARRIRRPNFWNLNPFVDISDPLNIRQGNINLIPETVHSYELNLNRSYDKGNFMVSAFFRNNIDDITRYSDTLTQEQFEALGNAAVSPDAILNTFINADFTNRYGLELNLQHKFNDRFDIMPSVNFQYRHVKAQVGELNLDNKGFNWETQLTANYMVASKKKWLDKLALQLTGEYESPEVIPQGRTIAEARVDFALRRDFLKSNKASFIFSVNDVFNSRRWGSDIETPNFIQDSYSRWNVRSFRLTFSYRFGSNDFQLLNKGKRNGGGYEEGGGGEG